MSWIVFSLLAAIIWAVMNIVDKAIFTTWRIAPLSFLYIFSILGLLTSGVIAVTAGFTSMTMMNILLGLLAGVCFMFTVWFYLQAVNAGEVSRVVPLFKLAPLFIVLFATMFLGELLTTGMYIGAALMLFGAYGISARQWTAIRIERASLLMLAAVLFLTVNQLLTKYLLDFADYWTIFGLVRVGTFLATIPLFVIYARQIQTMFTQKRASGMVIVSQLLSLLAILFMTMALADGYVSLANVLASTQALFLLVLSVVLGLFFPALLQEELSVAVVTKKTIAIVCMIVGGVLIL